MNKTGVVVSERTVRVLPETPNETGGGKGLAD